eukprot:1158792-Pelagomonas_calceolata.AAC.8
MDCMPLSLCYGWKHALHGSVSVSRLEAWIVSSTIAQVHGLWQTTWTLHGFAQRGTHCLISPQVQAQGPQQARRPAPKPVPEPIDYEVVVHTENKLGAGTDASVTAEIVGSLFTAQHTFGQVCFLRGVGERGSAHMRVGVHGCGKACKNVEGRVRDKEGQRSVPVPTDACEG